MSEAPAGFAAPKENSRLKKLEAELSLDKETLKGLIAKNGWGSSAIAGVPSF